MEERDARRNEGKRVKRMEAKIREEAERQAEAEREEAVADVLSVLIDQVVENWMVEEQPDVDEFNSWLEENGEDAIDDEEYDAFCDYLCEEHELEPEDYEPDAYLELFWEWRDSDQYEHWKLDNDVNEWDHDEWDRESVVSCASGNGYESHMHLCDGGWDGGEPDDSDDVDPGDDIGYEGVDEMRDEWDAICAPACHVKAEVRAHHGSVKLKLKVAPKHVFGGEGWEFDTYADAAYAHMEAAAYPFLSSPTCRPTIEEQPPPPRRVDYDLGELGRKAYHAARAAWYRKRTGQSLTGTVAQQEEKFDNACRYLRVRGERTGTGGECI